MEREGREREREVEKIKRKLMRGSNWLVVDIEDGYRV